MGGERLAGSGAAMSRPNTEYALAGDVHVAYQVIGDGPVDLVWAYGLASNLDVFWDEPSLAAFFRRLAEFSRLIVFDRRGCGLSDRSDAMTTPTLEERVEDVLAVLDAVGSEKASIFGVSEGGSLAALFASMHPERTASVIIYGTMSRMRRDAEHPWGWADDDFHERFIDATAATWGTVEGARAAVPVWARSMVGDERFVEWLTRYAQHSVSRNAIRPFLWSNAFYDLVDVFPAVRVPALVLHRQDDPLVPVSQAVRIASEVPDARLVVLPGVDHLPFLGDAEALAAEIQEFLVGTSGRAPLQRQLLTLVFTDIVDATARVAGLGDEAWRELLATHEREVRAHLSRFGGEEVKHLGDGWLSAFDGPARAIRCALGIVDAAERRGLTVRVGIHTGECEVVEGDVRGIAVHVASRIVEQAGPGQILVSSTVRDLVAGSGIRFGEERLVGLRGIPGPRVLLPVLTHGASPDAARRLAADQANVFRLGGEYWTLAYEGRIATLRDSKGVRDLARLLAAPAREVHVLDLAAAPGVSPHGAAPNRLPSDLRSDGVRTDPVIDEQARAAYERRIVQLEQDVDDARERGDLALAEQAAAELDALVSHLAAAYGLGGTVRRTPDHVERARKAVTRRIRDALSRIDDVHPLLGRHLRASVRTGVFCCYAPERTVSWAVGVDAGQGPVS